MTIIIEQNIMVAMRDGVRLATDIYRPTEEGHWPVLLTRVPYNKDLRMPPPFEEKRVFLEKNLNVERAVEAGYVVVAQDIRGCYASEGSFFPLSDEDATDGADTIAWLAHQPWSNGRVGMFGVSYQGYTQWQAAREHPKALQAIIPTQCLSFPPYQGGAFLLNPILETVLGQFVPEVLRRNIAQGQATIAELEEVVQAHRAMPVQYQHLPLVTQPLLEKRAPYYFDWLKHPTLDTYWQAMTVKQTVEPRVPTLIIAGWYDFFLTQNLEQYQRLKQKMSKCMLHLVIGPWAHGTFQGQQWDEASGGRERLVELQLRWFDHWLREIDNGIEQEKPVSIFVMGSNTWRQEEDWPLLNTRYRPYYLHSDGHANSASGDGVLSTVGPEKEPEDIYCSDPHDPIPTVGGVILMEGARNGPCDQSQIEARQDVLCYTTSPLEQPVEVTGPIELILYASSSACDTDFTAKLVDVFPNGRAQNLVDGVLRVRYRESFTRPTLMEPGYVYKLHIVVGATSNVFLAGHCIRLEIASSNFPRFDRNSNTGGTIAAEEEKDFMLVINAVYHNDEYPSHLILPVIKRSSN